MNVHTLSVARGRLGARCLLTSVVALVACTGLSAQVVQSFSGATGETPYTLGTQLGLVPLAPSAGFLSLLRVNGSVNPTDSQPHVVFDTTPDLSGTTATGSVVIEFDFKLSSGTAGYPADGFGVSLLATSAYGSTGGLTTAQASTLTNWERPSHANAFSVGFDIYESYVGDPGRKNQVSLNWNGMQLTGYNDGVASFALKNDKWNRVRIEIRKSGVSSFVTVRITADLSQANPTTYTLYDDYFVSGMSLPSSRLAFGARTGGCWALCDLDNVKTGYGEIHVNPTTGIDSATGTSLHPVQTIATGVSKAAARETVRLSAGTHTLGTSSAAGTVNIDKPLTIRGAGASGSGRTTVTGAWTDTLANATYYGSPLLYFTGNSDGSRVDGIEFVGGSAPNARRIGTGIRLLDTSYMTIENCAFLNIYNPGVLYLNTDGQDKTSYLAIRQSAFTNCGWENTVGATGLEGAVGGMIMGVGLKNSEFSDLSFTHTSPDLGGGGYGIKTIGLQTDNRYVRITSNLKSLASWKADANAGRAPTFAIETTANGGYWDQVYNNVIEECVFNNAISISPGYYAGYPDNTTMTFTIRKNVFNAPVDFNIEAMCSNMVIENNYSKRNNFIYCSGNPVRRMIVRNNVAENLFRNFMASYAPSDSLLIYNNTAHFADRYDQNWPYALINPVFVHFLQKNPDNGSTADVYRGIYNNFVTSSSTSTSQVFIRFEGPAVTNYNNQFIRNNHVHDFPLPTASTTAPGLGDVTGELANNTATTTSGGFTLTGNLVLGGTLGTTDYATYWQPRSGATQIVDKGVLSIPTNTSGAQGTTGGTFLTIPSGHYAGSTVDLGGVEYIPPTQ